MSGRFDSTLLDARMCGTDVLIARFERPAGYSFQAGQWMRVTLATGEEEQTRTLSHANSPADDWLEIATRLSSSTFKQALVALQVGEIVQITGPGGRFALPPDVQRVAFLIGGVGVTPVRSMLRDAWQSGRTFEDAPVLYGNRSPDCAPYLDELNDMAAIGVRVIPVFEKAPADAAVETGFVTAELVHRYVTEADTCAFVVAGPPVMTEAMEAVLDRVGVPLENRFVERFGERAKK